MAISHFKICDSLDNALVKYSEVAYGGLNNIFSAILCNINADAVKCKRKWNVKNVFFTFLLILCCFVPSCFAEDRSHLPPTCESMIYCHGPLLDTIQMAGLYRDSKTFVDMKLKKPEDITLALFGALMNRTQGSPSRKEIEEFVSDNFEKEGSEFEDWVPSDWKQKPALLEKIKDPHFRSWAGELHKLWLQLGRKMKSDVANNPHLYSIIYVKNPVIVPGGRFREFYYWDSYWIMKGLLLSEMKDTVKGMLSNFISIVDRQGHIPNGGRIYYNMRSQPPMLLPMVKLYIDNTQDKEFLEANLPILEKEFRFWMNNHTINIQRDGSSYRLAHYSDGSKGPRPESYREDVENARGFESLEDKEGFYAELKAAAESGWDFSTRWFILNGTNRGNLTNLMTRSIIPVDLNAIICWNAHLLAEFHDTLGHPTQADQYRIIEKEWIESIDKILWHEEIGTWLDYDVHNGKRRDYFYPSNIAPLWAGSYDVNKKEYYVNRIMKYLDNTKIDNYAGGLPTTFEHSGEQWDYPNAWPPLQHIVISGLKNVNIAAASRLAEEWATKWVRSNHMAWQEARAMFEKYDATMAGGHGGGGEYEIQLGFGWSNSVILDFLDMYSDMLSADEFGAPGQNNEINDIGYEIVDQGHLAGNVATASTSGIVTIVFAVMATLIAGALGFVVYRKRLEASKVGYESVKLIRGMKKPYTELKPMTQKR